MGLVYYWANLLIFRNATPYRMKRNGSGIAMAEMAPRMLIALPAPREANIGRTANGKAAPRMLRKNVLAEIALAAYRLKNVRGPGRVSKK